MIKKIFFIGLSGVSMSALSVLCNRQGSIAVGCDKFPENFQYKNINNYLQTDNHSHIDKTVDLVVYNSEIKENSFDIQTAKLLNIPMVHRTKFLDHVTSEYNKLCVSGMSGKTSTSYYISCLCKLLGLNVNSMIGEKVFHNNQQTYNFTSDKNMILELNEGDMSFNIDSSQTLVITNIVSDPDHIWLFKNQQHLFNKYKELVSKTKTLIYCRDYEILRDVSTQAENSISYGFYQDASARVIQIQNNVCQFIYKGDTYFIKNNNLIGNFSFLNMLAASLAIHCHFYIPLKNIISQCIHLHHPTRRTQLVYEDDKLRIIRDQCLHPFEIQASLEAIKNKYGTPITIFLNSYSEQRSIFSSDILKIVSPYKVYSNNKFFATCNTITYVDKEHDIFNCLSNTQGTLLFTYKGQVGSILNKWLIERKLYNKIKV